MRHSYQLSHQRILLRPLEETDIEALRSLRNENRAFFNTTAFITAEQQRDWFRRYLLRDGDVMFAAERAGRPGEFIGAIALYDIDLSTGTAEFGRTLLDKKKAPEHGLGTELVAAVCRVGFEQIGIVKITAEVLKTNGRAIAAYAKAGCKVIGENHRSWLLEMTANTIGRSQ